MDQTDLVLLSLLVTEHLVVLLHDIVERRFVVFHISDLSDERSEMLNPNRKQLFLSLYLNSKSTMTQFFLVLNPLWSVVLNSNQDKNEFYSTQLIVSGTFWGS
jgi:hypothetical protein